MSTDWSAKLGMAVEPPAPAEVQDVPSMAPTSHHATCQGCGKRVSQAAVEFCEARAEVFGGRILCMDCQRKARKGLL
jgi:hypothetical protein